VVGFTLLSNLSLLKRRSFWGIVVVALVLFIPHIWWQVSHNYPSLSYHLFDRSAKGYNFEQTGTYIPAQLAMAGPFIGWFIFYSAFKNRITDAFIRALLVNAVATFIFFFINTLKGEVQPHWTLIAFVPLVMLALIRISNINKPYIWLSRLAIINIAFIVLLRVSIMFGPDVLKNVGQLKSYYGFNEWAHLVKQKAGDSYVITNEGFQNPSKYDFYNNTLKGFSYDSRDYRYTQFDIWPLEDSLQHKRIYYLLQYPLKDVTTDTIKCEAGTWYGGWVDDARTYQKITIETGSKEIAAKQGQKIQFDLTITNPYPFAINFTNQGYKHAVALEVCTVMGKTIINVQPTDTLFNNIKLNAGQSARLKVACKCPAEKGDYSLFFSIRTDPFTGSRNSRQVKLKVE